MSSRHRQIHHAQNLSALQEQSPSSPFASGPGALSFPKGTYHLLRFSRKKYRDKRDVLKAMHEKYPGIVVGQQRSSPKFWTFECQLPPGTQPPEVEKPPEVTPPGGRIENRAPGIAKSSMWCAGCACLITVDPGATQYPEHKSPGSTHLCRHSNKVIQKTTAKKVEKKIV
jgi:hypothetical protein